MHRLLTWSLTVILGSTLLLNVNSSPARAEETTPTPAPKIMLLLDSSGSMGDSIGKGETKLSAAKHALEQVINELPEATSVGVRVFGSTVFSRTNKASCKDSKVLVPLGTNNKSALLQAVKNYKAYGETPIPYALESAAKDLGKNGPRTIVLVSDGESTCAPNPCVTAKKLRQTYPGLTINVLGLGVKGKTQQQLECVASAAKGTYFDAKATSTLASQLARVTRRSADPLKVSGEPTKTGSLNYPTSLSVGNFQTTIGPGNTPEGTQYFSFPVENPSSFYRVVAYTTGNPGVDGLTVKLTGVEKTTECGEDTDERGTGASLVSAEVALSPLCINESQVNIAVIRNSEGRGTVPLGLKLIEEPARLNTGFNAKPREGTSEAVKPKVTGKPKNVAGGASLENAPVLSQGVYSDVGVIGEPTFYRVQVGYGQTLRVSAKFSKFTGVNAVRLQDNTIYATLDLYNPLFEKLSPLGGSVTSGRIGLAPVMLFNSTPPISTSLTSYMEADYSVPGTYYVSVTVDDYKNIFEAPYELKIEVTGDAAPAPIYANGVTWNAVDGIQTPTEETPEAEPTPTDETPTAAPSTPINETPVATGATVNRFAVVLWGIISLGLVSALLFFYGSLYGKNKLRVKNSKNAQKK